MASYRKRGKVWYYRFIDADGIKREAKGCTDKRATEELARAAESEAAKIKAGLIDPSDLARKDHASRPIGEHIEAWGETLSAKGGTAEHVALSVNRVRRIVAIVRGAAPSEVERPRAAKFADLPAYEARLAEWLAPARLADLTTDRVQRALAALRESGLSLGSLNHYKTAVRSFGKWAWRSGRLASDPLTGLAGYNAKEDRRHDRRTLGTDELRRLIEAAHHGPTWRKMTGPNRALLYRLAIGTGLRYSELRSVRPESFDWTADPAVVKVEAAYTKNGEAALMVLPDDLASDLRPLAASTPPGEPIFPLTDDRGAAMLRRDLDAAGIPYRDAGGLVFDFHALRCQAATLLDAAGVSPRVVQRIMRHSTPGLTDRYTRPRAVDMQEAALSMPSLRATEPVPSVQAATGTDDLAHRLAVSEEGKNPREAVNPRSEGQPISKVFAHHLPTGGDGSGRTLSPPDATASSGERSSVEPKSLERRDLTHSDGGRRGRDGMGRGRVELPTHGFSIRCSTS